MYPGSGSSSGPGPGQLSLAHPPPRATCCRDQTLPLKRARAAGGESPGGKDSPLTSSARAHGRGLQLSGAHSPAGLSSGGPGLTVGLAATHPQGDLAGALAPGGGGRCLPHRELLASQARRADGGWGSANSCCCPSVSRPSPRSGRPGCDGGLPHPALPGACGARPPPSPGRAPGAAGRCAGRGR